MSYDSRNIILFLLVLFINSGPFTDATSPKSAMENSQLQADDEEFTVNVIGAEANITKNDTLLLARTYTQ